MTWGKNSYFLRMRCTNINNKIFPENLYPTIKFPLSWLPVFIHDVTSYTKCINSAFPRCSFPDGIRHARALLRKMTVQNKRKEARGSSEGNAALACKGEWEGGRVTEKESQMEAQFWQSCGWCNGESMSQWHWSGAALEKGWPSHRRDGKSRRSPSWGVGQLCGPQNRRAEWHLPTAILHMRCGVFGFPERRLSLQRCFNFLS